MATPTPNRTITPYIWESELPGDRCLRIEPRRSTAIVGCDVVKRIRDGQGWWCYERYDGKDKKLAGEGTQHKYIQMRGAAGSWREMSVEFPRVQELWGSACRGNLRVLLDLSRPRQ